MPDPAPPPRSTEATLPWFVAAWRRLTDPHASVQGAAERRRVRLATALILVVILAALLFIVVYTLPDVGHADFDDGVSVAAFVLLIAAYRVARSAHARIAVWMVIAVPWLAIAASFVAQPAVDHNLLYYGFIPVLLAGILLPPTRAAAFAAFNLAGSAFLLVGARAEGTTALAQEYVTHLLFMATGSALVIVASAFLQRSARDTEQANERLREADAYRLQLLNTIAHDLGSPLQPVLLQLDLVKRGMDPQKALSIIERNVQHLGRLVGDVRDLSKLESGRLALDRRPTDLSQLVRQAGEGFAEAAREKKVHLEVRADGPLPLEADPDRLTQVLYNLITNALKFTPPGGRVLLEASANDGHAAAGVRDTGRGLVPDEIARLFRPFSQVHERHEVKEKGTGLGLFISKGIVESHGGRIWVESDGHGRGSTFRFEVPVRAAATLAS